MSNAVGAAAIAAAFVILYDTVGSGPTFEKDQVVPAKELEFLGIERLLEVGAIAPYDPTPLPAPEPTETERLQAALAEVERRRGFYERRSAEALEDAKQAEARVRELEEDLRRALEAHEETVRQLETAEQQLRAKEADLVGVNRDRERLETELAALKGQATPAEPKPEPAPDPKPADKPAKKGG